MSKLLQISRPDFPSKRNCLNLEVNFCSNLNANSAKKLKSKLLNLFYGGKFDDLKQNLARIFKISGPGFDFCLFFSKMGAKFKGENMPKDANGTELNAGDNVTLIKDLKVKGAGATLKRGTLVKNIKITDSDKEIEGKIDKMGIIVLKTEFLKKA